MWGHSLSALPTLVVAVVLTAGTVAGGMALRAPEETVGPPPPRTLGPEPLGSYDASDATVARAAFCDRLPDTAAAAALGAEPSGTAHYGNGEPAELADEVRDVAHEFGCAFTADAAEARAWVFAPPVTLQGARQLATAARRATRQTEGCELAGDSPTFGQAPVVTVCRTTQRSVATYRGLVGDAWFSCSLSATEPGRTAAGPLLERAGDWCVQALEAARTD